MRRFTAGLALAGAILILGAVAAAIVAGNLQDSRWSHDIWIEGVTPGHDFFKPPFRPLSGGEVFHEDGTSGGSHVFLLGSDGGGRDLLGLIGRGAVPSLLLVAVVVLARMVVGVLAGLLMASGNTLVSAVSRGMGRWVAGFPYLALAVILVEALSPAPNRRTLAAFVVGMAVVGWRDVAEITARIVENVRVQPYTEAARALGTYGLAYVTRHLVPHLRPALAAELPFQASSVLVLLGELGFLHVFLGGTGIQLVYDSSNRGRLVSAFVLAPNPDLAELLSNARDYIQRAEWIPVLVPAAMIALLALSFEMLGFAVRVTSGRRRG